MFPTQGSNPGLPLCRQILYQLSYKGIPRILEWVAFSRGYSWPRNRIGVFCIAGGFFTNWAIKRAHNRYKVNSSSWVLRLCTAFIFFLLFWTKFSVLRFYRKKGEFLKKTPMDMTPKAQVRKEKLGKVDVIKIQNFFIKKKVSVAQSCPTLCDPMDCSPSGPSVHGILQERILQWVAIPFSRGSSWPRDWTWVSSIAGRFLTSLSHQEAQHRGRVKTQVHLQAFLKRGKRPLTTEICGPFFHSV